ncbi:MAG TPA: hypothetical protein VHE78_01645 [Gemmatimonadaceae bacterium]|nr:hypothetical protein [Gemmatimonadaceae bacterium]
MNGVWHGPMDDDARGQARPEEHRGRARDDDRGRDDEHGRGENRWRKDNARIAVQFFSSPRYRYTARNPYRSLPYGWDRVVYEDGYFPREYDAWCDNVPVDLEYQLPPLYRGYRRFIFGDRLVVSDSEFTRRDFLVAVAVPSRGSRELEWHGRAEYPVHRRR